ncbi:MAG: hypothetical protein R2867_10065 [Caldilineaceae bacterium]
MTDEKDRRAGCLLRTDALSANRLLEHTHMVRLAWAVQALVDVPCTAVDIATASLGCATDGYLHNIPQVIQTYYDEWTLTGLNVSEQHGATIAAIYEDPTVDANLKDDSALWLLSYGLDNAFLSGRDADPDGLRDVDLAEVVRRFDRVTNGAVTEDERWALPIRCVWKAQAIPRLARMSLTTAMTETKRILATTFTTPWQADPTIQPLILYATEARTRALGLDGANRGAGYVLFADQSATLNMQPNGQNRTPLNTVAALKWTAYCAADTTGTPAWEACAQDLRWHELDARHAANAALDGDPADPDIAAGRMIVTQLYNLTLSLGLSQLVERDLLATFADAGTVSDTAAANNVRNALQSSLKTITFIANQVVMARYVSKVSVLKFLAVKWKRFLAGNAVGRAGVRAVETLRNFRQNRVAGTGIVLGVTAVIGGLVTLVAFAAAGNDDAQLALKFTVLGLVTLLTTLDLVMTTYRWAQAFAASGLSRSAILLQRSEAIGISKTANAIGAAIAIAIVWGFFIYSMVSNGVTPFSPEFNQALSEAIAATIYIIVLAIISATVIGAVLVAILVLIDLILTIICEAGVDELRDTNGGNKGCFTIGGTVIKYLAKFIYAFDIMIEPDRDDFVVTGKPSMTIADPAKGLTTGNPITVQMPVTTTIVHKDPDPSNWQILFYTWFYTRSNLRSTTVRYSLTEGPANLNVGRNGMADQWQGVGVDHRWAGTAMYGGYAVSNHAPMVWQPQPGLNRSSELHLNMGYAFPAYECWTIYALIAVIPVCYTRSLEDHTTKPFDQLRFDIFPATIDDFMMMTSDGNGSLKLAWDPAFRAQRCRW